MIRYHLLTKPFLHVKWSSVTIKQTRSFNPILIVKMMIFCISLCTLAQGTLTVISSMVIYDTRILINRETVMVIHGRAALPALANLGGPQQYFSNQHRLRGVQEIMKLSSNPPAIRTFHTKPGLNHDELHCQCTVILRWSYITVNSLGES